MTMNADNLILIGMPGSGKSTVGVILAKKTSRDFVDTDLLIQNSEKRSLQTILDTDGYLVLREIEEKELVKLHVANHVIATGGSAPYSDKAMLHLRATGKLVFLDLDLATVKLRIGDYSERGIAKRPEQTLEDLFDERYKLYKKHADITISCSGLNQEQVCQNIIDATAD